MTTQTMTEPVPAIQAIALAKIIPTLDNPRRKIKPNDPKLLELAESIKRSTQLQPGVGRPHPTKPGCIDLRAGCRRHAACTAAGLDTMLVVVRDMDDRTAMEVTVLENLQRDDLSPLEEARGIQKLLEVGEDPDVIASKMGKDRVWLKRRAQLLKLTPKWAEWAEEYNIGPAHLELIARYSPATQDELFDEITDWEWNKYFLGNGSINELRKKLAKETHELKLAPWKLDDAVLVPQCGSCTVCQKRSSCNPELFDDLNGKKIKAGDTCLDVACWNKKHESFIAREEAELTKKYGKIIAVSEYTYSAPPGGLNASQYTKVAMGTSGAVPAKIAASKHDNTPAQLIWIKPKGDSKAAKAAKNKAAGKPATSMAEKRAMLENRRKALAIAHLRNAIDRSPVPKHWTLEVAAANVAIFGTDTRNDHAQARHWGQRVKSRKASHSDLIESLLKRVAPIWNRRLVIYTASDASRMWSEAENIAAELDIDLKALKAAADAEIPEPKSWAKEKA